jgi:ubiquitin C-terminal hydrolase
MITIIVSRLNSLSKNTKTTNQSEGINRPVNYNTNSIGSSLNNSLLSNSNKLNLPVDLVRTQSEGNTSKPKNNWDRETYQPYNLYTRDKEKEKENVTEEKLLRDISKRNLISRGKENTNERANDFTPVLKNNISSCSINSLSNLNNNNSLCSTSESTQGSNPPIILCMKQVGMDNLGNTCFMNTSLQCLIHTEPFIRRFFSEKDKITGNTSIRPTPTSRTIFDLCNEIIRKAEGARVSVSPSEFKRVFGSAHRIFSGYSQHDTQEFLRVLLDDISQELNRVIKMPKYRELDTKVNNKVRLNSEYDSLCKAREDSIVTDTFSSQLVNIFTCLDCNYETFSFEKYIDIPLLLEKDDPSGISMSSLLDDFFGSDKIKFESPCENSRCKKKSYHSKFVKLSFLPEILMLSFQRNNGRARRKNTSPILFEERIDLSKYVDKECIGKFYRKLLIFI